MHVNILILIVYILNYQSNTILYENMRNKKEKSGSSSNLVVLLQGKRSISITSSLVLYPSLKI